jgi:excisionase family DNA binding protein
MHEPDMLTMEEVARELKVSRTKAYAMAAHGRLPVIRMDRSIRMRRQTLLHWMDEQERVSVSMREDLPWQRGLRARE